MELTVLLLARNEERSLEKLLPLLQALVAEARGEGEILLVDGSSEDATRQIGASFGARVIPQKEPGYGAAFREGVSEAQGEFILTLDADGSHSVEDALKLLQSRHKADLIIGSRYVPGGRYRGRPGRYFLSRLLNCVYKSLLGSPFADMSSGLRLYRKESLEGLDLQGRAFDILPEVLFKLYARGKRIIEIPITFQARTEGRSKARYLELIPAYLRTLLRLRRLRRSAPRHPPRTEAPRSARNAGQAMRPPA